MSWKWPRDSRGRTALYALGLAAVIALASPLWDALRLTPLNRMASFQFRVTTDADAGPGSLRAAILDADHATGRAKIVISVAQITVRTALPPLVNPSGVILESTGATEIRGGQVTGAVLDVAAPASVLSNLRIVGGRVGVIVRAPGVTLHQIAVSQTDVGVFIGAGASDIRVDQSTFLSNRIGIQLSVDNGMTTVLDSQFDKHRMAAVWAASGGGTSDAQLVLLSNRLRENRSGVVVVGLTADVERNVFEDTGGEAIHASSARMLVKDNTIRSGVGFGVYLEGSDSGRIEHNEIANNCAGGIMVRSVANANIDGNQIYQNGHGIVLMEGSALKPTAIVDNLVADHFADGVVLIGSAAVVTGNRVLRNRHTGMHFSALLDTGGRARPGQPLLDRNVVTGNGRDEAYDTYRPSPRPGSHRSPTVRGGQGRSNPSLP